MNLTPRELDWLISGVRVNLYRRPRDNQAYATIHDFERFGVKLIETIRAPIPGPEFVGPWSPLFDPRVVARLAELNRG